MLSVDPHRSLRLDEFFRFNKMTSSMQSMADPEQTFCGGKNDFNIFILGSTVQVVNYIRKLF